MPYQPYFRIQNDLQKWMHLAVNKKSIWLDVISCDILRYYGIKSIVLIFQLIRLCHVFTVLFKKLLVRIFSRNLSKWSGSSVLSPNKLQAMYSS